MTNVVSMPTTFRPRPVVRRRGWRGDYRVYYRGVFAVTKVVVCPDGARNRRDHVKWVMSFGAEVFRFTSTRREAVEIGCRLMDEHHSKR